MLVGEVPEPLLGEVQPPAVVAHVDVTIGWPPWKIHESMIRRTGSPVASSMASHRSVVSVLPYWWLAM